MTASPDRSSSRHWWRDQFARLIITIIGGVVAALILTVVIPSLGSSGDSGENPDATSEQPADGESEAPAESDQPESEPDPAPAEGE